MALACSNRWYYMLNKSNKKNVLLTLGNEIQHSVPVVYFHKPEDAPKPKLSRAVQAYLKKVAESDAFMKQQLEEFELGKKFLANMMGRGSKEMTQEDIDNAIEYLFPSALFVPGARPKMKPPHEIFKNQITLEFDLDGRPFHHLFYTLKPKFSECLSEAATILEKLNKLMYKKKTHPQPLILGGGKWPTEEELSEKFNEKLFEYEYNKFLEIFNKIKDHPFAIEAQDFIKKYWIPAAVTETVNVLPTVITKDNVTISTIEGARKKTSFARVSVSSPGSGKIQINNMGLDYFVNMTRREQKELKMDLSKDREIRRKRFGRSISFQKDLPLDNPSQKHRTVTPSFLSRLRSFKEDRASMLQRSKHVDLEEPSSSALDDIIFLESFEEVTSKEDVTVIVSRDIIRQDLMDLMKSRGGNVELLNELEMGSITHRNIEESFRNSSAFEKNVAFLWAAFLRRRDLLDFFCRNNVDLNFCEPHQGFSALHLSSFSGCNNCTGFIISKGADVNLQSGNYTPLHCSAFGDSPQTAEVLIKAGAKIIPEKGCSETPVHSAVRSKAIECLKLFVREDVDLNNPGECGFSPLHLAADLGYVQCLEVLLDSRKCDINAPTSDRKNTPLHLAAENGFVECVKVLLEHGADPNSNNYRQQSPLHAAAKVCLESVELLLKYGADPNSQDVDNRTPVHAAVCKSEFEHSLDIIECLNLWRGDVNRRDKYGYTPLHIAALNELSECVECLILQGSDVTARTRGGTSALSIISRKTPAALSAVSRKLDECITANDPDASSKEIILKFNFRYLLQSCKSGEISFLQTFVEEGQKEILGHPLCEAFLHLKWLKIRKYYIARLIFCSLYVLILSVYVLTALAYQCYNDSVSDIHPDAEARILIVDPELCTKKSYFGDLLRRNPIIMEMEWFLLAFITVLEIFRKIYGFRGYKSVRHYVSQKGNLVEWFVVFSVFLISFVYTGRTYIWQNHVGALAVLCGWANLMIMIGNLPIFGSYVTMYTKVQKEFTKLFLAYICLLIGFTVCFCVIFPKAKQFSNPFVALIKILVMMTGELEFDDLLENITEEGSNSAALLEASALTTFVFFLLFVTIILMNLLIGIAVHDIQGLQKTAVLSKLVGQTKLITHIESALFNGCLPNCFLKLLQITALISPSAYRVVVSVKPLNPRETRLPQEVMRSALEIAKQKKTKGTISARSSIRCNTSKKRKIDELDLGELQSTLTKLLAEMEAIKQIVNGRKDF